MKKVNSNKLRPHQELIVKLKRKIILGPLCTFLYVLSESYPESSFKRYFFLRNSWSRYSYSICPNWTLKIKSADTRQRQGFAISLVLREQISGSSTSAVTSSMPLAHRCLSTNPMEARVAHSEWDGEEHGINQVSWLVPNCGVSMVLISLAISRVYAATWLSWNREISQLYVLYLFV